MKKKILIISFIFGLVATSFAQTNLISNPGAESNYDGWVNNGLSAGWAINVEGEIKSEVKGIPHSGDNYWGSTHYTCPLEQTIDLLAAGYSETRIDEISDIHVGAYIRTNEYSGGYATIKVELCSASGSVISTHYVCNNELFPANTNWTDKSLVISNYEIGVRKIIFTLIGKDSKGWAGYFGPAFDDSYLYISDIKTGTKSALTDEITVYPNPASDYINIGKENGLVKIYNINGSLVFNQEKINSTQINVSSLPKGVYVVKTETQNIRFVKK